MYPEEQQPKSYSDEEIENYRNTHNFNAEPQHHKHAKIVLVSAFVFLLLIVIGAVYLLTNSKGDEDNTTAQDSTQQVQDEVPEAKQANIPEGFVAYSGDGFGFYYPSTWGDVVVDSKAEATVYSASFSKNDRAKLYLNTGNQDFNGDEPDGAYWDCVGFTEAGTKDIACKTVYIGDDGKVLSGSVLVDAENIINLDTREYVYLNKREYTEILFNPGSSTYYGGTLILTSLVDGDLELMRQIGSTFSVNLTEGL